MSLQGTIVRDRLHSELCPLGVKFLDTRRLFRREIYYV